ncbi:MULTISPECIES: phosphoglycerate dehydrogenase [unclassified Actinopolyspora]|uniref:phosphoglycerate dehydrogenase n=1 Tax=unclassified Actinopolyspora TaxID=2639451 RepID=UPI0013F68883|nr:MULTISPECIES: phosphoglycerate dehydrogenase [unclassified Actinopolyspora]NHD15955.1 phosphoglycerate dehydrogenase [Actinopolyspora sp. BKK2]NHE74831.1 phosphoglycerate dehydrogenase [Actinopolyspora sp. BKK1]
MSSILITTPTFGRFSAEPGNVLAEAGDVIHPHNTHPMSPGELLERVPRADALIVGMDTIDTEVLDAGPRLRVIAKHGVGVDTIDVAAARQRGIRVVSAPGSNARAVAELAFGLMLAAARKLATAHTAVLDARWPKPFGPELAGKTLGILGFGRIGRLLAGYAGAFGMRVLAHDPHLDTEEIAAHGAHPVGFTECLREAEFVSLHLPGSSDERPLLDRAALESMQRGAVLVNTARGGLVDGNALAELLRRGQLGGAGLDAFAVEPPSVQDPLLNAPNVVLSPHIGACSHEANHNMGMTVAADVVRVLSGREPDNEVPQPPAR